MKNKANEKEILLLLNVQSGKELIQETLILLLPKLI